MPNHITLRPLEANLTGQLKNIEKIHPYFVVALGHTKVKSQPAKKGGRTPEWGDAVSLDSAEAKYCKLKLKTKRALLPDKTIGVCEISLDDLNEEKVSRWYDVVHKNKIAGRILIEGSILSNRVSQSANALDERRDPLIDPSENQRQVASLGHLGQDQGSEGQEVVRNVEVSEVRKPDVIRIIEPIEDVDDHENNDIVKDADYQGTMRAADIQQQQKRLEGREAGTPVIIIQRDSVIEDIPAERDEDEQISGVVSFAHH